MSLHTFVIGLGRAGSGLHLPVLRRLRRDARTTAVMSTAPIAVFDPNAPRPCAEDGLRTVPSIRDARALADPRHTVVHLCVPPDARRETVHQLAAAGFTKVVLEKPLSAHLTDADEIVQTAQRNGMDMVVVAHWLSAELTRRLALAIRSGEYGRLRAIVVRQHKPRFERSLRAHTGETAFDIELPHGLGLVLSLAGPAKLADASCSPVRCDGRRTAWLGGAHLVLRHDDGVRSHLASDLTAPVRQRSVTLKFDGATVTGHYPVSADDSYAQLTVRARRGRTHTVFRDDALTTFLATAYRYFAGLCPPPPGADLERHREIVRILTEAKRRCGVPEPLTVPAPRTAPTSAKETHRARS
jgi:predicted dehydrogenase